MNKQVNYNDAYNAKKFSNGVYIMNEFCSSIHETAGIEDIRNILRLYYDEPITYAQNEFVTEVLNAIVQRSPREATKEIIKNIMVLKQEEAERSIGDIFIIFFHWHKQFTTIFLDELKKVNEDTQKYILDNLKYFAEHEDDKVYLKVLEQYSE